MGVVSDRPALASATVPTSSSRSSSVMFARMVQSGYALHSRLPHILWSADPPAAYVLDHL